MLWAAGNELWGVAEGRRLPAAVMEVQLQLLLRTRHTTVAKREADCMLLGCSLRVQAYSR